MKQMSQLILRLQIASRKALLNKKADKKTDTLKVKLLFLLSVGQTLPPDLISELCINKSNLALLAKELQQDGLIYKRRLDGDKRNISMHLTDKGIKYLEDSLSDIEGYCESAFGSGYDDAAERLQLALDVLDFI